MIPRNPDRVPKQKAEMAETTGILNTMQLTKNAAITP